MPIIAAGLFYRAGYFRQAISREGWQQESYPVLDPDGLPLSVLRHPDGTAALVTLSLPDGKALTARVWRVAVGRITLLLLDTDIPENEDALRSVTDRLYGGGGEHRLLQELLLGVGGVRAIKLYTQLSGEPFPEVFHTNEGHAGFLGLERISDLIGNGLTFDEALQVYAPAPCSRRTRPCQRASTGSTSRPSPATSPPTCFPASRPRTSCRSASRSTRAATRSSSTWP